MTDWIPETSWTCNPEKIGLYMVKVLVRDGEHSGPDEGDSFTSQSLEIEPKLIAELPIDKVRDIKFSPNDNILASASRNDSDITLWDVASGTQIRTFKGHLDWVHVIKFSPDGRTLASGSHDFTIKLWDVASGAEIKTLRGHSNVVKSLAFSPDGGILASGGSSEDIEDSVKLWDIESGKEIRTLNSIDQSFGLDFSPNGRILASASNKQIMLWDVASGTEIRILKGGTWTASVAFSPDGRILAIGDFNPNNLTLWDIDREESLHTLNGGSPIAFSPDGSMLASGKPSGGHFFDQWGGFSLWDMTKYTEICPWFFGEKTVHGITFSPDGRTLAVAINDEIDLWKLVA
jgi:WD40 repeat protein